MEDQERHWPAPYRLRSSTTSTQRKIIMKSPSIKHEQPSIRILKIATCPSLSDRSTLTYHIGCKGDSASNIEILFRLYSNSSNGFFNKEWVSSNAIQKVFEKYTPTTPITSFSLNGIFQGKSVNTSGFLLAILKAEGLIVTMKDKRRYYQRVESDAFVTEIKNLMASSIALKADDKPAMAAKIIKKTIQKEGTKKD